MKVDPKFKRQLIALFVMFLCTIVLLVMIDLGTFRLSPSGHTSGNGNPAILIVFLFIPLYIGFLSVVAMVSHALMMEGLKERKYHVGLLLFLLIVTALLIMFEVSYVQQLFRTLGGLPDNPESAVYRFGYWNQYTNTAYVNIITYTLGLIIAVVCGYVTALLKNTKS